jgi:hypothetical protein
VSNDSAAKSKSEPQRAQRTQRFPLYFFVIFVFFVFFAVKKLFAEEKCTMNKKGARRSAILMGLACMLFILAACSREETGRVFEPLALDQFPQGLGRGFPQVAAVPAGQRAVVGEDAPDFSFVLADDRRRTSSWQR